MAFEYGDMLATIKEKQWALADIDWDAPEFAVTPDDERWILSMSDPLGRHPWYREQPVGAQIAIGQWRSWFPIVPRDPDPTAGRRAWRSPRGGVRCGCPRVPMSRWN
jgi:hypothetical protein